MCTQVLCTKPPKKRITGLQREEETARCREDWAGEASGGKDKGRQAVYLRRYSRQKRRAVGSGIQRRMSSRSSRKMERIRVEKTNETTCRRSSLQNMLNYSSSQVARGHPQEQSLRWLICLFREATDTWSGCRGSWSRWVWDTVSTKSSAATSSARQKNQVGWFPQSACGLLSCLSLMNCHYKSPAACYTNVLHRTNMQRQIKWKGIFGPDVYSAIICCGRTIKLTFIAWFQTHTGSLLEAQL